jgi:hypothetical protein
MTGLYDVDIRLTDAWELTQATNGDAPLCSGLDCLYQNIAIEAVTQKGDLFYEPTFGWSLYDFIQAEDDELTRMELRQRVRISLQGRTVIQSDSIQIKLERIGDTFRISCSFQFHSEEQNRQLNIIISTVSVEVI